MSEDKNLMKWAPFSAADAAVAKEEFDRGDGTFLKMQAGKNKLRFLPRLVTQEKLFVQVHEHYVQGVGRFVCSRLQYRKFCAVCDKQKEYERNGNTKDRELAKDWKPRKRFYANVIDRSHPEDGPKIFAFGPGIYGDLLKIAADEDVGGDFTNPGDNGFDIVITRAGTGMDTEYTVHASKNASRLGNDEWIELQEDLTFLTVEQDADEVTTALAGDIQERPAEKDKPRARVTSVTNRPNRGRTAQDDVDDNSVVDTD